MWWPLVDQDAGPDSPAVTSRFHYQSVTRDIESLNRAAEEGELEITALSCAHYPRVADRYALTTCGSSIGDQHGPRIVARQRMSAGDLTRGESVLAVPGERTSAFAAASILLGPGSFRYAVVPFDEIIPRLAAGEFDAGLVIHEGQLTFAEAGLTLVADLGMWWSSRCGLPLPLGVNAIRRDLPGPENTLEAITGDLYRSIQFALAHRAAALDYALQFARDTPRALVEQFVSLYVNRWTTDLGSVGRAAVQTFLNESHAAGLCPDPGRIDFVGPG